MIVVWELTQGDGTKFVSAEELKRHIGRSEDYLKKACEAMTKEPRARLVSKEGHLTEKQVGRMATLGYRLAEEAVIIKETARILIELLRSHDSHRVNREQFVMQMVSEYGMDPDEVNDRIDEGIKFGYIEKVPEKSLRGREVINLEIDYLIYLADKVPRRYPHENPPKAIPETKSQGPKPKRRDPRK
jgi:hypothetical protein